MSEKLIRFERERLYQEVWSQPIKRLAKQYGLSDVGLAKICKKLKIPRPPRGFWAKKAAGKRVQVSPLPPGGDLNEIVVRRPRAAYDSEDEKQQGEADRKIALEKRPDNRIDVPASLNSPHDLVRHTMLHLRSSEDSLFLSPQDSGCLDVRVSRGSHDRAMRIMDALIKTLVKRGYALVDVGAKETPTFEILGESLGFSLFEQQDRLERSLTRAELLEKQKNRWRFVTPEYEYVPSSRLTLRIRASRGRGLQKSWSDTDKSHLEDRLNAFVVGLIRVSVRQRAERLEQERRQREYDEQQREAWERQRQRQDEERKLAQLNRDVDAWCRAERIRAYLEAVRQAATNEHGEDKISGELAKWLQWASDQADCYDPLMESPSRAIDE